MLRRASLRHSFAALSDDPHRRRRRLGRTGPAASAATLSPPTPTPTHQVLCDVSGRLESATRQNLTRRMAEGRNVGIIPGGFEDATLHVQGRERTAMSDRKGLIKCE